MQAFQDTHNQQDEQMQSSIDDIEKMLDDPNTAESSKAQIRQALEQTKKEKVGFQDMHKNNQEKMQDQIKRAKSKLGSIASEEEIALVDQYKAEIKAAFDGVFRLGRRASQTF